MRVRRSRFEARYCAYFFGIASVTDEDVLVGVASL